MMDFIMTKSVTKAYFYTNNVSFKSKKTPVRRFFCFSVSAIKSIQPQFEPGYRSHQTNLKNRQFYHLR